MTKYLYRILSIAVAYLEELFLFQKLWMARRRKAKETGLGISPVAGLAPSRECAQRVRRLLGPRYLNTR